MKVPNVEDLGVAEVAKKLGPWTLGGLGIGAGAVAGEEALMKATKGGGNDDNARIQHALALEAMREGSNPDMELLKMYLNKTSSMRLDRAVPAVMGGTALVGLPAMAVALGHKETKGKEAADKARLEALLARGMYEKNLRGTVLGSAGITPEQLTAKIKELEQASEPQAEEPKLAFEIPEHAATAGAAALGLGSAGLLYHNLKDTGKKDAEGNKMLADYRRNLELASQMSNKPVGGGGLFSPEEMLAMEALRGSGKAKPASGIKADIVKDTKGGAETPSVSANPSDPELERLLASV